VVLVAATALVCVADLRGWPPVAQVRVAAAAVLGPLERVAHGGAPTGPSDAAPPEVERARLGLDAAAAVRAATEAQRLRDLLESPATRGLALVPARVVAVGASGAGGPERVTIDAGSRDGLRPDLTVVAAEGLVGRVVSVAPWTADVLLVGSPGLTVAVRVGEPGALGSASGAVGARPRPAGQLGLELVERAQVSTGDAVTTLGSPGGTPFVAGVPVGRVAVVDPTAGRPAPGGAVALSVDTTTLDVVGVVVSRARTTPRAAVSAPVTGPGTGG
jgi:rod shape-determining protein MreC